MADLLDEMASDLKAIVRETCAKVADIHHIPGPVNDWQRGYNEAVAEIAAKIREL